MKFCWVTFPVVRYRIPYTETIPIFSIARKRFYDEEKYLTAICRKHFIHHANSYLEWNQVTPHSRLISGLDLVIKMIKNDIIDELVPSKNFCHLSDSSFTHFHPVSWPVQYFKDTTIFSVLPEHLVLDLELQFGFESFRSIRSKRAHLQESGRGQSLVQLREDDI